MKMSRRALRMERTYKRHKGSTQLNLVSLMDIFTILVFFLLVNASDVEVLPSTKSVKLPESFAQQHPEEAVTVMVTNEAILVQGRRILSVQEALDSELTDIPALQKALEAMSARAILTPGEDALRPEMNIMADKTIPYRLLKKIMLTGTKANYGQVSLAVMQKYPDNDE